MIKQTEKPNLLLSETKVGADSAVITKSPLWFTELRRNAENRIASLPSLAETASSEFDAKRLFQELQVLQIELEIQNEELERQATAEKSDYGSHLHHHTDIDYTQRLSAFEKDLSFLREQITRREMSILLLVGRGNTSREIADQLGISLKTVERHRANMMRKLNTKNTATLTRWAVIAEFMATAAG